MDQPLTLLLNPYVPLLSAIAAAGSAVAAWFAYRVNHRSMIAKLLDRLYELDKLALANPSAFARLLSSASWEASEFRDSSSQARTAEYVQVKAISFFYMNLFEEIQAALGGLRPHSTWPTWETFILKRLQHPLLKQLAEEQCVTGKDGRLLPDTGSVFGQRFVAFLTESQDRWRNATPANTGEFF